MAAEGLPPSVADVAERAGISRATAYRYFPSREFLVVEMALPIDQLRAALSQAGHDDPARRIAAMIRTVAEWSYDHQLVLREMLRVSLVQGAANPEYHRPNTRLELIARELKPIQAQLTPAAFKKLSTALTLLLGIECIVVLQDMARVSRGEAIDTLVWMASNLVNSASRRSGKS